MQIPVQIRFHGIDPSPAIEAKVHEHVGKLEQFYSGIIGCRVAIEALHQHHRQGNLFSAKIWLTLPEGEIAATRDAGHDHRHEDFYVALHDAFRAARRQLEQFARKRRGEVKHHEDPPYGRVITIDPEAGTGTILTPDGREIAFSRNSIVEAKFESLTPGTEVRFTEAAGAGGPAASTLHVIGKHRPG